MAKVRYLSSTKKPGLRFKIIGRRIENPEDPATAKVFLKLEGAQGITFERMVSDDILERYGYIIEVVDDEAVPVP